MTAFDVGRDALYARVGDSVDSVAPGPVARLGAALLAATARGIFTDLHVTVGCGPDGGIAWELREAD